MLILSMLATLVYGGFSQAARNRERLDQQNAFYQETSLVLERMAREMSMAYVSTHISPSLVLRQMVSGFVGKDRARRHRVDFTAFAHRRLDQQAKESDQSEIGYFVASDPENTRGMVLARREQVPIDDDPTQGGRAVVLLRGVESLEFAYLDPLNLEWVNRWDTLQINEQPNRLPLQAKIILKIRPPFDPKQTLTFATRTNFGLRWGLNHANYTP